MVEQILKRKRTRRRKDEGRGTKKVLMRPPEALSAALAGGDSSSQDWRAPYESVAQELDRGFLTTESHSLLADMCGKSVALATEDETYAAVDSAAGADGNVLAAALRGYAASELSAKHLESLRGERQVDMAADAYGVPVTLRCPVLILAVEADAAHPVKAAEALSDLLQGSKLVVAADTKAARKDWPATINAFLRQAWMQEFLTKRVMPQ
eukprot:TRINITY_DN9071_c0_g1_i1.p1 TRINITY_DN9071_c0_g1~~TRINITY_DN9071_c0_g1_i1.p1  ORF type:complete len:210 (-),score=47.18 TRINITY_DN9071_c0_g1_i1:219-848(-)